MNIQEAFKINLEMLLEKLTRKHFNLYLKLSHTDIKDTKDIWEEMKLIDKKIKEIQKELEVYEDFY